MTIYQRLNYPYAFKCWFSGSCDDLRALIAFCWLSWIVLTFLAIITVASIVSNAALVPFMASMHGAESAEKRSAVVFDKEAFEYHTAPLIGCASNSSEYALAFESQPGADQATEKSRLVEDVD